MKLTKDEIQILARNAVAKLNTQIKQQIEEIKDKANFKEKAKADLVALSIFLNTMSEEFKQELFGYRYKAPTVDELITIYLNNLDNLPEFFRPNCLDAEISLLSKECKTIEELRAKIDSTKWFDVLK